jgi:hypothetical protein
MSRFPYSKPQGMTGKPGVLPFIPLTLYYTHDGIHITKQVTVPALVDSGSTVMFFLVILVNGLGWIGMSSVPH